MKGKAIIFSAPSGAGKTTIVKYILGLGLGLEFSISACSRPPRPGEINGRDYYFMSAEEFRRRIRQNQFVEWEEVYPDHYYGTLRSELEHIWKRGRHVIFDVDVAGGLNLKKAFGKDALAVFVRPPSMEILKKRLFERSTDKEEIIQTRIAKAVSEMKYANRFDEILVNDKLEDTLARAEKITRDFLQI